MHGFFAPHPFVAELPFPLWALAVAALWVLVLKGFALWYAARGGQRWWFVFLLVVNTLGLLEIIYLLWFRPASFELEEQPADSSAVA